MTARQIVTVVVIIIMLFAAALGTFVVVQWAAPSSPPLEYQVQIPTEIAPPTIQSPTLIPTALANPLLHVYTTAADTGYLQLDPAHAVWETVQLMKGDALEIRSNGVAIISVVSEGYKRIRIYDDIAGILVVNPFMLASVENALSHSRGHVCTPLTLVVTAAGSPTDSGCLVYIPYADPTSNDMENWLAKVFANNYNLGIKGGLALYRLLTGEYSYDEGLGMSRDAWETLVSLYRGDHLDTPSSRVLFFNISQIP